MTRRITIDTDTSVSYIFKDAIYEIQNKGTTTQRTNVNDAFNVLKVVAPTTTVTKNDLISLANTYELLTSLSYTLNSTGSYIHTIQFNDYKEYPLTLDAEKGKMYIMNSNVMFDLTLNVSNTDRVLSISDFYYRTLGLQLFTLNGNTRDYSNVAFLHDLLLSYFTPTTDNNTVNTLVEEDTENNSLKYTNKIYSSNYSKQLPLTYTLTLNPNNTYTPSTTQQAHILQLQENIITLTTTTPDWVHVGDMLNLSNVNTTVNGTTYTADGNYTVTGIEDNTITVSENFPTPYLYQPPTLNLVAYKSFIEAISREDNTITVDNQTDLSSLLIGDIITVTGTIIDTGLERLTVDGNYTISAIHGHTITVEEQPITNYSYSTGTQPYLYKSMFIGNVASIVKGTTTSTITLESNPLIETLTNSEIYLRRQDNTIQYLTTTAPITSNTIEVTPNIDTWESNIGILAKREPSTEVLITITDSSNTKMPNTSFIVDTHEQATQYISLLETLPTPAEICYNISNTYVPKYYKDKAGTEVVIDGIKLECIGLYDNIYTGEA